jgi:glycosyltransferase involved in cell wall biosynthesis
MTNKPVSLTVTIPTYNRSAAVAARVREFLEADFGAHEVDLLVVDNCSTDDTWAALGEFSDPRVRVEHNERNVGYAGNLVRVLRSSRADYTLVISDEDELQVDGVLQLLEFCERKRPGFVSPRAQVGARDDYRGHHQTREIDPAEFIAAAFYISGLTFETRQTRVLLDRVEPLLGTNSAATVYPQVLLAALALVEGGCFFLDALVSVQRVSLDTHIVESNGDRYTGVAARWNQFVGYEDFFQQVRTERADSVAIVDRMIAANRESLMPRLRRARVSSITGRSKRARSGRNPRRA